MAVIYVLKNLLNDKLYVGQTTHLKHRMRAHRSSKDNTVIDRAINKYGWDSFRKHVFHVPEPMLNYFEIEMIKRLGARVPDGYNVTDGGKGMRGWHPSVESRMKAGKKISIALTGGKRGAHTEAGRRHISEAKKGKKIKPCTEEHKRKLRDAAIGKHDHRGERNPMYGKCHTEEAIAKMGATKRLKWR